MKVSTSVLAVIATSTIATAHDVSIVQMYMTIHGREIIGSTSHLISTHYVINANCI